MIPNFTQDLFLRALGEWGLYPARFSALASDDRAAFLKKQGFSSLHDILAHVGVWWEEAEGIIRDTLEKRERPRRKYDFDEFNAVSLERFRNTPDAQFLEWYEAQRQRMVELVSSLTDEQMKIRRVPAWLDAVVLLHLKEHGVGAPRFLVLDMLQREWAAYMERFRGLSEEEQTAFLQKQGFPRFRDLLAHIVAWWEEGLQLIDSVAKDPSYRMPDMDVDAYNARVLEMFGALDESDVWKKYEATRAALLELLINLPTEVYEHQQVQDWLKSDVIEHYFDHAV
jgi:hypothetical protein